MASRLPARITKRASFATLAKSRASTVVPRAAIRLASTSSRYPSLEPVPKRGIKIGHVFSALALLGITATSYGLYQFYSTFTVYPDSDTHPIRSKLRAAIRAESSAEYERASAFFQQAYDLALDLHKQGQLASSTDREASLLKLSGIAVRWGGMWEQVGQLSKAIEVYDLAFQPIAHALEESKAALTSGSAAVEEVKRGAGIAMKLGDLWTILGITTLGLAQEAESEAERYYAWSVEELMRLSLTPEQKLKVKESMDRQNAGTSAEQAPPSATASPAKEEDKGVDLPDWVAEVELVAAFERLGDLYSRQGRIELAQPLLLQAISTLYPPPKKDAAREPPPPIARRCHAATLMNNLSSSLVTAPSPSAQAIEASAQWARQALNVSNSCKREADKHKSTNAVVPLREREEVECELTAVVACYNLGKLAEMSKDSVVAEQWFIKSEKLATELGLRDAAMQARESLRRLKHPTVAQ
ncbi:uncharacterized protein JCM15063_004015 [Sporobolomyces koalae]|uniref:uncharacterized protein n=1 Tax=Sporobolomyces koalae TaxID=500713 RepID=UPI003177024E